MSFNWPEIPFVGPEVEAFVTAYKELAESIYENFLDEAGFDENVTTGGPHLKAPFRNGEVVRNLLEVGLIYSSFIIQQRSGADGPGTDFDLGNSPINKIMGSTEWYNLLKKAGCIYDEEEILDALRKQLEGDDPTPLDDEEWLDNLLNEIGNEDPDPDDIDTEKEDPPPPKCSPGPLRTAQFALANAGWPMLRVKASALWKYVNCDPTPFTENDLGSNELNALKNKLQGFMDAVNNKNLSHCSTISGGGGFGVPAGGTASQCNFYNAAGESRGLRNFLGTAVIITDSNGNVVGVRDDMDFVYGKELVRTDGSLPGDPYEITDVRDGLSFQTHARDHNQNPVPVDHPSAVKVNGIVVTYPPMTFEEAYNHHTGERHIVIDSQKNDGGLPVPIKINF